MARGRTLQAAREPLAGGLRRLHPSRARSPCVVRQLIRTRPLAASATAVVAAEALLALLGLRSPVFSAAALLAPGLALTPLLPEPARRSWTVALAAAPALGAAAACALLIS